VLAHTFRRLGAIWLLPAVLSLLLAPALEEECPRTKLLDGTCPTTSAQSQGDSVDLYGSQPGSPSAPPSSGSGGGTGANTGGDQGTSGGSPAPATPTAPPLWRPDPNQVLGPGTLPDGTEYLGGAIPIVRDPWEIIDPPTEALAQILTINDLVNFRPSAGTLHMEPAGWTVVGLTTNFWIDAAPNTQDGALLGAPAAVRFTPVGFSFGYGDSVGSTSTNPGSTWTSQQLSEFDVTPTGHTFTEPGSYVVTASVQYSAEYQFAGGPWVPVTGTVSIPTNTLSVVAARASTVLVNNTCITAPDGPGC
jgi:hypothetical protein